MHPSWYSRSTDTRGRKITDYGIRNWDIPTSHPPNPEPSSPDVPLTSVTVITACSWQTLSTLSSGHLPILIRLQMKTTTNPRLRRTYVNLKRGNGNRYRQEVESALNRHSLSTDYQRARSFIQFYSTHHHTTSILDDTRRFQRLPHARCGTDQRKIIHLPYWSQLIHPGPTSCRSKFLWSRVSCARQR